MACIVAIHQPNFFPWLGYFDKIRRADVFIFLDAVAYPRSGSSGMGSWTNRVKLAIQGKAQWVTCPLHKLPSGAPIYDAKIVDHQPWRKKTLKTLQANYGKASNYGAAVELLAPLIEAPETNLASYNISAIRRLASALGLETRFVRQSELSHEGTATELLISLVEAVGGTTYLAGGGAGGYQEDQLLANAGLALQYQNFVPRPYGDLDAFLPGLSVIDYLMRDGRPLTEATSEGSG